jgi:HlyD family secretion protein
VSDPARVYTDAFPKRYFTAAVSEISQQAEFTPRDIHMKDERVKLVFAVKLAIHNPQGILKPGMPVDARLRWNPEDPLGGWTGVIHDPGDRGQGPLQAIRRDDSR